ncbi:DUF6934 family protein [Spirosoma areae]
MNFPPYLFDHSPNGLVYAVESTSSKRTIQKYVIFTLIKPSCYNLALVDLDEDGQLSDTTISNNQDMERVLSTVIQIIATSLKENMGTEVVFSGSTPERTRLYRLIINKYSGEVANTMLVHGVLANQKREIFQPNRPYISFVLSLM